MGTARRAATLSIDIRLDAREGEMVERRAVACVWREVFDGVRNPKQTLSLYGGVQYGQQRHRVLEIEVAFIIRSSPEHGINSVIAVDAETAPLPLPPRKGATSGDFGETRLQLCARHARNSNHPRVSLIFLLLLTFESAMNHGLGFDRRRRAARNIDVPAGLCSALRRNPSYSNISSMWLCNMET